MIIALVIGLGFVVLLVAPTIHRRINHNSRERARLAKEARAKELRDSSSGRSIRFNTAQRAVRARDRLLISGIRAELVDEGTATALVFHQDDEQRVNEVIAELDSE